MIFWIAILIQGNPAFPGSFDIPSGAREAGLAGISSVIRSPFAAFNNQACMVSDAMFSAGLSHHQLYMAGDLNLSSLCLNIKAGRSNLGLGFSQSGFSGFRNYRTGVMAAGKFGEIFAAGIALFYHHTSVAENGASFQSVSYSAGICFNPNTAFSIGIFAINPVNPVRPGNRLFIVPSRYVAGAMYSISDRISIMAELEKPFYQDLVFRFGFEFGSGRMPRLRGGFQVQPFHMAFGASFNIRKLIISIAIAYHEYLGLTPSVSFDYQDLKK